MGSAGIRERRAFVLIHMFFAKYINSKVWGWRANSHSGFKVTRCRPLCKALSSSSSHYKKAYGYFSRKTHHISFSCLTYDFKKKRQLNRKKHLNLNISKWDFFGLLSQCEAVKKSRGERMYIFIRRKNSLAAASSSSSLSAIWLSIMSSASSSITNRLIAFLPWKLLLLSVLIPRTIHEKNKKGLEKLEKNAETCVIWPRDGDEETPP